MGTGAIMFSTAIRSLKRRSKDRIWGNNDSESFTKSTPSYFRMRTATIYMVFQEALTEKPPMMTYRNP